MRTLLLASAASLLIGGAAFAQNSNSPASGTASNISGGPSRGAVAPKLPISAEDASADQFLMSAQSALKRGRTGEAQEALERAETRMLDRSTAPSEAATADSSPRVASVREARMALGRHDRAGAEKAIEAALATSGNSASSTMPTGTMPGSTMPGMVMGKPPTTSVPTTSQATGTFGAPQATYSGNGTTSAIQNGQLPLGTAPTAVPSGTPTTSQANGTFGTPQATYSGNSTTQQIQNSAQQPIAPSP